MPAVQVGGITLDYEERGDDGDPLVLLIAGLGSQRLSWPTRFVDGLVGHGLRVVAFDNRDVGCSTILDDHPVTGSTVSAAVRGEPVEPVYTLADMAADTVGLLDHLGVARAHVVGMSMGGMIAQHVALGSPERIASLVLYATTTGAREVGQPTGEARGVLFRAPSSTDREAFVEDFLRRRLVIGTDPVDRAAVCELAGRVFDRGVHPQGTGRQLLAIHADGERTGQLGGVTAPTLVLHGALDPLIGVSGGEAVASAIPGAELVIIDGLAHDLPGPHLPRLVSLITEHVHRSQ